jgi:hypothetical protein
LAVGQLPYSSPKASVALAVGQLPYPFPKASSQLSAPKFLASLSALQWALPVVHFSS